jgi:hypothetical protein
MASEGGLRRLGMDLVTNKAVSKVRTVGVKTTTLLRALKDPTAQRLYQYQPLDSSKNQIRLLRVFRKRGRRRVEIYTFDFLAAPDYVALSYTWGDARPEYQIALRDGQYLIIRENLNRFLHTYHGDDYLWIDQICINQLDAGERSSQVRLMADIYRQCTFVAVWLESVGSGAYNGEISHEHKLFRDRYFTRLWIVQEILLAPDVRLLLQQGWMTQNEIRRVAARSQGSNMSRLLSGMRHKVPYDLGYLIDGYSRHECEDPRDIVYGLMGLLSPSERVTIDYTKTAHEVYCDVVLAMSSSYSRKYSSIIVSTAAPLVSPHQDPNRYSFKLQMNETSSLILSDRMGFSMSEQLALRLLLRNIWRPETFASIPASAHSGHYPITAMGFFSLENSSGAPENTPEDHLPTRDSWWYVKDSHTYYHLVP